MSIYGRDISWKRKYISKNFSEKFPFETVLQSPTNRFLVTRSITCDLPKPRVLLWYAGLITLISWGGDASLLLL